MHPKHSPMKTMNESIYKSYLIIVDLSPSLVMQDQSMSAALSLDTGSGHTQAVYLAFVT
jgi:hypothetical protein